MGSRGPYAYTVDEEATGSLVQATQQDCHWGFKPGWLPPKLVSVHGGKGSRSSGLVIDLAARGRANPEMV